MSKFEDKEIRTPADLARIKPRDKRTPEEMRALFNRISTSMDGRELVTFSGEPSHKDMQRRMAEHSAKWRENRQMREPKREGECASSDSVTDANVVPFARAGSLSPPSRNSFESSDEEPLYQLAAEENDASQDAVLSRANIRLIFEDRYLDVFSNRNVTSGVFVKVVDLEPGCSKVKVGKYRFRLEEWADDPAFAMMSGLTLETLRKLATEDEHGQSEIKAQSLD